MIRYPTFGAVCQGPSEPPDPEKADVVQVDFDRYPGCVERKTCYNTFDQTNIWMRGRIRSAHTAFFQRESHKLEDRIKPEDTL
jgi:hypothetical protein